MKTLNQAILLSIAVLFGLSAAASDFEHTPTKIQFNQRIDNTASAQSDLSSDISNYFEDDVDELMQEKIIEDKEKVVEFVDAELHIGGRDEKKLVDRRYNSVGPAKVAKIPSKSDVEKN